MVGCALLLSCRATCPSPAKVNCAHAAAEGDPALLAGHCMLDYGTRHSGVFDGEK